jgi:transposase
MANQVISMQQIRALLHLLEKGHSLRAMSEQLGISRQPITTYVARLKGSSHTLEALRGMSDSQLADIVYATAGEIDYSDNERRMDFVARVPYFMEELKRTGVTRALLWEEYKKECKDPYRYTQFCILVKEAGKVTQATMHLVHVPGAMVMVDFAGDKMNYVDQSTGEIILCPVLVCVLPYSKYTFAVALPNATIPQVIKGLNACLSYFGGVPLSLKTDNLRQVVTKSCRYEPVFTEAMQQWSLHYNIPLLATRVPRPKDKGAVENEVKIAYQRIYAPLRDAVFHSITELNVAVLKQLALHNEKLFQLKDHSRIQQFNTEEKALLQGLPAETFVVKHQVLSKVQKNYHITLGENYHHYSVPYQYIGKQVSAVYDTDIVEIYHLHRRIALHTRSYKKHGFTTIGEHMPDGHQQFYEQQGWTPAHFLNEAVRIGPSVHDYMDAVLKSRSFTEQTYNACRGILRLHNQYGAKRMQAACARALNGSVFNYRTIRNILLMNQDLLDTDSQNDLFRVPDHANLRGPNAYQ